MDFLLEIGTEEVPASGVTAATTQLHDLFPELLARERLRFTRVTAWGTPRRLVAYVMEIAARQEDAVVRHRGPARAAAFDAAGSPTRAAEGFARRFGLGPEELRVGATEQGEYVFAEQRVEGRPAGEVLAETIPGLLAALSFPKSMRWGEGQFRFSRPIRSVVERLPPRWLGRAWCSARARVAVSLVGSGISGATGEVVTMKT